MADYSKKIGRLTLEVCKEGYTDPDYRYGATLSSPAGRNDAVDVHKIDLSLEELRDLKYLIERALAQNG